MNEQTEISSIDKNQICVFNLYPTHSLNSHWFEQFDQADHIAHIVSSEQTRHYLDHYLLSRFNLQGQYIWFENTDWIESIGLQSRTRLIALLLRVGVCCISQSIRRVIAREEVMHIKRQLGDTVYRYALKHAECSLPELTFAQSQPAIHCLHDYVLGCGVTLYCAAVAQQPWALLGRMALKLPPQYYPYFAAAKPAIKPTKARSVFEQLKIDLTDLPHITD